LGSISNAFNKEEHRMGLLRRFRINRPAVVHETFDKEVVIIEFNSGNYYSLDKAGADIWNFIEREATFDEIVEGISHLYEGSRSVIQNAVNQLLAELQQEELIVLDNTKGHESTKEVKVSFNSRPGTEKPDFEVPVINKYTDMQDLLLLDPIHEVDETGWPNIKQNSLLEKK
jgi:hypothetical protein